MPVVRPLLRYVSCSFGAFLFLLPCALVAGAEFERPVIDAANPRLLRTSAGRFEMRAMDYQPTPIGESPAAGPFTVFGDTRLIHRDGPWLRGANVNTLRLYGALVTDSQGNLVSMRLTHAFARAAAEEGLWIIPESYIPTSAGFSDEAVRARFVEAHVAFVEEFANEPNVLMWSIGNEINSYLSEVRPWYETLDAVAGAIKTVQGGSGGAVGPFTTTVNGDCYCCGGGCTVVDEEAPASVGGMTIATNVDAWGVNIYRGCTFGDLFELVASAPGKPYWIGEFGIDSLHTTQPDGSGIDDELSQALFVRSLWSQLRLHSDLVIGGVGGMYTDEWWKWTDNWNHNPGGNAFANGPDNFLSEEYLGVMRIERVAGSIDRVIPKEAYFALQDIWECPPPTAPIPIAANFDAANLGKDLTNDLGGYLFASLSGTTVGYTNPEPGVVGYLGDHRFELRKSFTYQSGDYLFVVMTWDPGGELAGHDFTAYDTLSFDVWRGTASDHAKWTVRLEDDYHANQWASNKRVAIPSLSTSPQHVSIPLADFLTTNAAPEKTRIAQMVIEADLAGIAAGTPIFADLNLDNIIVSAGAPMICRYGRAPTVTVDSLETTSPYPVIRGSINDSAATLAVSVGILLGVGENHEDGTWSASFHGEPIEPGVYDVQVLALDHAGNLGTDSTTDELRILSAGSMLILH